MSCRRARLLTLVVCAAALTPTFATAQNAVREGAAEASATPSASTGAIAQNAAHEGSRVAARNPVRTTLAVVEQPRAIGYFVGDKIAQRVLLESGGRALAPVSLPIPGRVSAWFERRGASVETDASSRHWLVIQYQILNAPSKLITVKLPAWTLAIKGNAAPTPAALRIPEAQVNVAPLSPPGSPTQVGIADLRADRSPPTIATSPIRRALAISAGAFALTLITWLAWVVWRNRRAQATQPFASALREMRALDDREPRAWQALHRAFDRTAGRVIQSSTLPTLFERAPQLLPARREIEQFFAQSSLLFFGASPVTAAAPASGGAPTSLAALAPGGAPTTRAAPAPGGAPTTRAALAPGAAPTSLAAPAPGVMSATSVASAPGAAPTSRATSVSGPASALSTPAAPPAASSPSPRDLCIELRRIEKRHEQ